MPRPIWSGSISFGLVNVPVKLMTAVSQKEVHFHLLHKKDGARIKLKRFCTEEDKEVDYEDTAKGYEVSPGRYVSIDREELEKLDPKATRSIEITDFVKLVEIDPIYYESTYHLVPDRGADKAYGLLFRSMEDAQRVGIARMVMRTKQYLCAVRPLEHGLVLSTMLYADEIVPEEDIEGIPERTPRAGEKELAMAHQLIESLTVKFDPAKYKDEYRERVLELIDAKAKGEVIQMPKAERREKVVNLMDALKKSLERREKGAAGEARGTKTVTRHRAAAHERRRKKR
ncbi:MAG TPA: Ku protein [Myxococcales bacterium]|nr:Ku protein [Myxococcales bacterium]